MAHDPNITSDQLNAGMSIRHNFPLVSLNKEYVHNIQIIASP